MYPRADFHNDLIAMRDQFRRGHVAGRAAGAGGLWIKNSSGSDLDRFDILGIDDVVYNHADNDAEFWNNFHLKGITPDIEDHVGGFAVVQGPVADGEFAECLVTGCTPAQVDIQDANDLYCDIADATSGNLKSYAAASARILHKPTGTGVKWCLVQLGMRQGPATRYRGLVNETGGFDNTDTTIAVDNLKGLNGVPVHSSLSTVYNIDGWSGSDNDIIWIYYNADDHQWEIGNIGCST